MSSHVPPAPPTRQRNQPIAVAGPLALLAALVELAQRDAARGSTEAAAWLAELRTQVRRPRGWLFAAPPTGRPAPAPEP